MQCELCDKADQWWHVGITHNITHNMTCVTEFSNLIFRPDENRRDG